jgi:CMP-N,N'-diacetyllegionaminic acid synthase
MDAVRQGRRERPYRGGMGATEDAASRRPAPHRDTGAHHVGSSFRAVAFVPARSGSQRVPQKNVRPLAGHPLLAYAIATALESGVFERVVVSTDAEEIAEIARWYGADVPFLRPAEYATSTSPDIEWLAFTLERLEERYDLFAIVRATNPFRGPATIRRGLEQLLATPEADSLRAVELVKQHPGKMWVLAEDRRTMTPLLEQSQLEVAWHAGQYQALPPVYAQNSALEIAWTRVVAETGTREGRVIAPFFTEGQEGFNVDDEEDWERAERLLAAGTAGVPTLGREPYAPAG